MGKMRKKGKRIRWSAKTPVNFALNKDEALQLQIEPHAALDRLLYGSADSDDVANLCLRVNWGQMLSMTIDDISQQSDLLGLDKGITALSELILRHKQTGRFVLSGDNARSIGDALCITDDLQKLATKRQLKDSLFALQKASKGLRYGEISTVNGAKC